MALVQTGAPALEPVSLVEAKQHLRIDGTAEDALIASLILTSRLHIEAALGLALITQSWALALDRWPKSSAVILPLRPVQSVTSVRVLDLDGVPRVIPPSDYVLDGKGLPPRLVRTTGAWPQPGRSASGIEIAFAAGFGASPVDVPAPIRQAHLLLVAHWYEHRDPLEIGAPESSIPRAVSDLLMPFRVERL